MILYAIYIISIPVALRHDRGDCTCRLPTMLFWVGTKAKQSPNLRY